MKALTINQPWAWMIVNGFKRVENRSWRPDGSYRGPLAIHAGKGRAGMRRCNEAALRAIVPALPATDEFVFGAVLGVVDLVDCVSVAEWLAPNPDEPFAKGPYCWVVANPRVLVRPVPYRGEQRLFEIPDAIAGPFDRAGPQTREPNGTVCLNVVTDTAYLS